MRTDGISQISQTQSVFQISDAEQSQDNLQEEIDENIVDSYVAGEFDESIMSPSGTSNNISSKLARLQQELNKIPMSPQERMKLLSKVALYGNNTIASALLAKAGMSFSCYNPSLMNMMNSYMLGGNVNSGQDDLFLSPTMLMALYGSQASSSGSTRKRSKGMKGPGGMRFSPAYSQQASYHNDLEGIDEEGVGELEEVEDMGDIEAEDMGDIEDEDMGDLGEVGDDLGDTDDFSDVDIDSSE